MIVMNVVVIEMINVHLAQEIKFTTKENVKIIVHQEHFYHQQIHALIVTLTVKNVVDHQITNVQLVQVIKFYMKDNVLIPAHKEHFYKVIIATNAINHVLIVMDLHQMIV